MIALAFGEEIRLVTEFALISVITLFTVVVASFALSVRREETVWAWTHTVVFVQVKTVLAPFTRFAVVALFTVLYARIAHAV